jgi:hypothetical protein
MAKPIKATPILTGKEALEFLKQIEENKNKKVSKEELDRIMETSKLFANKACTIKS